MKTMNENSFICIKINSWLSTIGFRQHFFLSIDFFFIIIISTADLPLIWSDQTRFSQHSFLSSISYRSTLQQLTFFDQTKASSAFFSIKRLFFYQLFFFIIIYFNSWLFWSNEISPALLSIIDFIQINISTADFFEKISPAFIFIIDSYRSNLNFFQLK